MSDSARYRVVKRSTVALVIFVVCLLLSWGLCGLGFRQDARVHTGYPSTLDFVGMCGLILSAGGVVVSLVVLAVAGLRAALKKS